MRASAIPSASPRSTPGSCIDLPQPRLRRVLFRDARDLLVSAAAPAERAAADRQLCLLRLGPSVVAGVAADDDDDRLLVGEADSGIRARGSGISNCEALAVGQHH